MQRITREDLKIMNEDLHRDFVLVNVLPREDFNQRHIRTSINIPVDRADFVEQMEAVIGDKNRDTVVYCADFECKASPRAAHDLEEAGFGNVYDYEGGTADWFEAKEQEEQEEKEQGTEQEERQARSQAGRGSR